jgi:hypothetical protein
MNQRGPKQQTTNGLQVDKDPTCMHPSVDLLAEPFGIEVRFSKRHLAPKTI